MLHPLQYRMIETELVDKAGRENVLTHEADRMIYGVDYMWVPRMWIDRGRKPPLPEFVVLPGTVEEVAAVVELANVYRIPVIPWGGGSGSQGGIMPVYGGITLDLKRLNRIMEINEMSQTVTAQSGINGYELECSLNSAGYTLGHIPASLHSATLGGYIACRGSGVLSTKYGKIEDIVLSLEVVLPEGAVIRTLPLPNHAAGPGILNLFVGAEGLYGVITEATLRIERLPEERVFGAFLFSSFSRGLEAGKRIMLERLGPSLIRLYDEKETLKRIKKVLGLSLDKGSYMVLGFEGRRALIEVQQRLAVSLLKDMGAEELSADIAWEWWKHRYNFYFPPYALDLPWMFGTMDTLCTFDKMENLYNTKKNRLEQGYAVWGLEYLAHLSHWYPWGVMIYDRFIIQNPPEDADEALALHNEIWNVAVRTSIECGGVLNEHHGVGLKLARLMREQYGPAFRVLDGMKNALDPHNVLNPGKMGFGPTH
jgi:alkyldihydroxyacetonephosphate synthase